VPGLSGRARRNRCLICGVFHTLAGTPVDLVKLLYSQLETPAIHTEHRPPSELFQRQRRRLVSCLKEWLNATFLVRGKHILTAHR
jgi:hypothetical protein